MADCQKSLDSVSLNLELPRELAAKRLIGLGEATHGSGGLHELATALMERAITDLGSDTILFEAPHGVVEKINDRISQGLEVGPEDMRDLYFNWRSREILEFFNRLSRFNRDRRAINIIGIDIRQPAHDLVKVKQYLSSAGKSIVDLADFPVSGDVQSFAEFERQILQHQKNIDKDQSARLLGKLSLIEASLASVASSKAQREILGSVLRLKAWVRTYSHLSVEQEYDQGFLARDEGMAEMAEFYLPRGKGPALIWAHLAHLVFDSIKVESEHSWFKVGNLLGSILKKKLKFDYSVIALMAKETEVVLVNGDRKLFISAPGSLESLGPNVGKAVKILKADDLKSMGGTVVGDTSDNSSPVKVTYIKMKVQSAEQFDFAAIRGKSTALKDVLK